MPWGSIAENCPKTSCKRRHFLIQNSWKNTCLNESAFRRPAVEMTAPLEVLESIVENCLRTGKETSSGLIFPPEVSMPTGVQIQGWAKTWMWNHSHIKATKPINGIIPWSNLGFVLLLIWKISPGYDCLTKGGTRKWQFKEEPSMASRVWLQRHDTDSLCNY